jgi:cytochrome b involved in lipid metabolism
MAPRDSYSYAAAPSANIFEGEAPSDEKKELVIGDRAYDVTAFIRRHPGGKIIAYQVGTDATDAYKQFHVRSTKADKVLKSLPSRALHKGYSPRRAALVADFQTFTAQLEAEGMFKPSIRHVVYRLAEVVGMHLAGAALIYNGWVLAGIMMLGVVQGRSESGCPGPQTHSPAVGGRRRTADLTRPAVRGLATRWLAAGCRPSARLARPPAGRLRSDFGFER